MRSGDTEARKDVAIALLNSKSYCVQNGKFIWKNFIQEIKLVLKQLEFQKCREASASLQPGRPLVKGYSLFGGHCKYL